MLYRKKGLVIIKNIYSQEEKKKKKCQLDSVWANIKSLLALVLRVTKNLLFQKKRKPLNATSRYWESLEEQKVLCNG